LSGQRQYVNFSKHWAKGS